MIEFKDGIRIDRESVTVFYKSGSIYERFTIAISELEMYADISGIMERRTKYVDGFKETYDISFEQFMYDPELREEFRDFLFTTVNSLIAISNIPTFTNSYYLSFNYPDKKDYWVTGKKENKPLKILLDKKIVEDEIEMLEITSQYLCFDAFADLYPEVYNQLLIKIAIRICNLDSPPSEATEDLSYPVLRSELAAKEIHLQAMYAENLQLKIEIDQLKNNLPLKLQA